MRLAIQFVVRQSGWLAFSFVLFALLNAAYVCAGLWQRSGLHGYIIGRGGRGGPPHVVSVWAGFGLGWRVWCWLLFGATLAGRVTGIEMPAYS